MTYKGWVWAKSEGSLMRSLPHATEPCLARFRTCMVPQMRKGQPYDTGQGPLIHMAVDFNPGRFHKMRRLSASSTNDAVGRQVARS